MAKKKNKSKAAQVQDQITATEARLADARKAQRRSEELLIDLEDREARRQARAARKRGSRT